MISAEKINNYPLFLFSQNIDFSLFISNKIKLIVFTITADKKLGRMMYQIVLFPSANNYHTTLAMLFLPLPPFFLIWSIQLQPVTSNPTDTIRFTVSCTFSYIIMCCHWCCLFSLYLFTLSCYHIPICILNIHFFYQLTASVISCTLWQRRMLT